MQILDGNKTSASIKEEIKAVVHKLKMDGAKVPHLVAILVGEDGASQAYVGNKVRFCEQVGYKSTLLRFPSDITEQELLVQIHNLNNDDDVDGFIVQLPLPKHINELNITDAIHPEKDVDGFHPINVGKMVQQLPGMISATPKGIIELLKRYKVPTEGKHCVVIGRSNIVGMPMSILLSQKASPGNCTVTLCHSKTVDIHKHLLQADIIVAAIGIPHFVKADMVKKGAVVIDVGITRVADSSNPKGYVLRGDVDYDAVAPKCSFITPVPGGVGPMTVASLMLNTLEAAQKKQESWMSSI